MTPDRFAWIVTLVVVLLVSAGIGWFLPIWLGIPCGLVLGFVAARWGRPWLARTITRRLRTRLEEAAERVERERRVWADLAEVHVLMIRLSLGPRRVGRGPGSVPVDRRPRIGGGS